MKFVQRKIQRRCDCQRTDDDGPIVNYCSSPQRLLKYFSNLCIKPGVLEIVARIRGAERVLGKQGPCGRAVEGVASNTVR
jgi:hypothetical protein